jgi:protein-disulfide isomerase
MNKLLTFLIMLVVGMALFAMPVAGVPATSAKNTAEAVPQFAGAFAIVTDVSPAIALAENSFITINAIEVSVTNNYLFTGTEFGNRLTRQEANPFYGRSKTAGTSTNETLTLFPDRRV